MLKAHPTATDAHNNPHRSTTLNKRTEPFLKICAAHTSVIPSETLPALSSEHERLRNITQLQQQALSLQTENELMHSEQRFRLFVEAVRDYALFLLDPKGNITTWNTGAERIKGYKSSEIIGKHFAVFYPEEDLKTRKPWRELEVAAEEGRFEDEGWRLRKDGTKFWANVVITALKDPDGRLYGFGKVTRDLTERRRAHQRLEKAYDRLQAEVVERRKAEKRLYESEQSLRKLSLHLLRTQDEERRRIGRELHDSVGQSLAMLKINLVSLRLALPTSQAALLSQVEQSVQLSDEALTEIRTLSYLLYPPMLEEMGLKSAVPWYLDGFTKRSQIKTSLEVSPDLRRLPRDVELALFRVLQESLTNVHKHSGSATAHVRLFQEQESDKVVLEIEDEGKGLPPVMLESSDNPSTSLGVGLRGMTERMRQLGGSLEVKPGKKGTIVRAVIPGALSKETEIQEPVADEEPEAA